MQKEYQNTNMVDSLWQVNKRAESGKFVLEVICWILFAMVGVAMLVSCQWKFLPVFYLGSLAVVILFKGVLRGIRKARYEEDLEEAYKDEYDYAATKEIVNDPRYRCVDEREVLRRTICDHEIRTIYLLAAVTVMAGLIVYFFMNPNPAFQDLIRGFYVQVGALQ